MLTLEQIQKRLKICNISTVEDESGVSRNALNLIREKGKDANPEFKTVEKISNYFEEQER